MNAEDIINRLATQLKDPNNTRWTTAVLLSYVEDGQRRICKEKPDALALNDVVKLKAGAQQDVPIDSHRFIRGVKNMGSDGLTPGAGITPANVPDMDRFNPNWRTENPGTVVEEYLFEYDQPLIFWVSPPVQTDSDVYIEIQTAKVPADILDLSATLELSDIYSDALYEYGMYRALSRDDETANNIEAEKHRQRFLQAIGVKTKADLDQRVRVKNEEG